MVGINGMNVLGRYINFGEEDILAKFVVGVWIVERNSSLIGVENAPTNPFSI